MKKVKFLKMLGNKIASLAIGQRCVPFFAYQPKPPAKLQSKMRNSK